MEDQFVIPDDWRDRYEQSFDELFVDDRIALLVSRLAHMEVIQRIQLAETVGCHAAKQAKAFFYLRGHEFRIEFEVTTDPADGKEATFNRYNIQTRYH